MAKKTGWQYRRSRWYSGWRLVGAAAARVTWFQCLPSMYRRCWATCLRETPWPPW